MKIICSMLGGSHSYGLQTATSDQDIRGVFIHDEVKYLVGLGRHDHEQKQNESEDTVYTELRHTLTLLRQGNTQSIELLYNENWIRISDEWKLIVKNREKLVDSERLFSCLRGYIQGEKKLANGERTGKLGSKRKEAIDRWGFSPKNFTQILRLAWCGQTYFSQGFFPVDTKINPILNGLLLDIKTHPEKYTKDELNEVVDESEREMVNDFENRVFNTKFDENLADDLCLEIYGGIVTEKFLKVPLDEVKKSLYTY